MSYWKHVILSMFCIALNGDMLYSQFKAGGQSDKIDVQQVY